MGFLDGVVAEGGVEGRECLEGFDEVGVEGRDCFVGLQEGGVETGDGRIKGCTRDDVGVVRRGDEGVEAWNLEKRGLEGCGRGEGGVVG